MESSLKNKFIIFKILTIFYLLAFTKIVYAQGSAVDQYRQMGGIVGLTETCFKTNNLEIILFKQVGQVFFSQPQMGLMMTQLLTAYFESKQIDSLVCFNTFTPNSPFETANKPLSKSITSGKILKL